MAEKRNRRKPHRGRRKKKKGERLYQAILVAAIAVFCISGFMLLKYTREYMAGRSEYKDVRKLAINEEEGGSGFRVNFNELIEANPETVGWLRFYPEPSTISYPVAQAADNDKYLHMTFLQEANAAGAIFLAAENKNTFLDRNSILYGHRMNDRSMFWHLEDYKDKGFWEKNPYFYIYTPDGHELTYHIYSTGVVEDTSQTYQTTFASDEEYQAFLDMTKEVAEYDTGIEVGIDNTIVTLSTCTSANDHHRYVVRGVLEKDVPLQEG